jgi:hypothetical protein
VSPRQKIGGFLDAQSLCRNCTVRRQACPSRSACHPRPWEFSDVPQRLAADLDGSLDERLLLEAGFGGTYFGVGNFERDPTARAA